MLLFAGLGLIGAMPVFFLVASSRRQTLAVAQRGTMKFLDGWGGIAPKSVADWVRTTIGSGVGFAFLVALAFAFNYLCDGAMPTISRVFGHFGSHHVAWSEEHRPDWEEFRDEVRDRWGIVHPEQSLSSPAAWGAWKNERGKEMVRAPRTLVFFSLLLALAGGLDLRSKRFRSRGLTLLCVGLLSFVLFSLLWSNRKAHYVREVMMANRVLGDRQVPVPDSWSGAAKEGAL